MVRELKSVSTTMCLKFSRQKNLNDSESTLQKRVRSAIASAITLGCILLVAAPAYSDDTQVAPAPLTDENLAELLKNSTLSQHPEIEKRAARTIRALDENEALALCITALNRVKSTLDQIRSSHGDRSTASIDAQAVFPGDDLIEKCDQVNNLNQYLASLTKSKYYFGGISVQGGVELNLGQGFRRGLVFGNNFGGKVTVGALLTVAIDGEESESPVSLFPVVSFTATPLSRSLGSSSPVEILAQVTVFYVPNRNVKSVDDLGGTYLTVGMDFPTPLKSQFLAKSTSFVNLHYNIASDVYAFTISLFKLSGAETGTKDMHAEFMYMMINDSKEGNRPDLPLWESWKDLGQLLVREIPAAIRSVQSLVGAAQDK